MNLMRALLRVYSRGDVEDARRQIGNRRNMNAMLEIVWQVETDTHTTLELELHLETHLLV